VFREDLPLDESKGDLQLTPIAQTREEGENAGTWAEALTSLFLGSKPATSVRTHLPSAIHSS
jgi:hypothetical protein